VERHEVLGTKRNAECRLHFNCTSLALGVIAVALGCAEAGPELIPVSGKVTIDGKLAKEGGVVFHGEGNRKMVGAIAADGSYKMMHKREEGVPAGNYRVTVFVTATPADAQGNPIDLPKTLSSKKFMDPATTPLAVQVQSSAPGGAYDLAVTR
jgi:hypothetical protein